MNNSTSRQAAIATSPARPPLPRSVRRRTGGVRSTPPPSNTNVVNNRRQSNPMAYSTITTSSSATKSHTPSSLLSPLALTAVKSLSCGSHEFLTLGNNSSSCESRSLIHLDEDTIQQNNNNNSLPCVNYDTNPTPLYLSIQSNDWSDVISRTSTHPNEVVTFVSRYELDDTTLRWKLLPIHAAIIFNAPYQVVEALINVDSRCVKEKDDQGKLPLHLSLRSANNQTKKKSDEEHKNNVKVVQLLLEVYPQSVNVVDGKGRTPLMLVNNLPVDERDDYIRLFEHVEMKNKMVEEGIGGGGLSIKTNEAYSTKVVVPSSNTKPPRVVPTATIRERRRKACIDSSTTSKTYKSDNKKTTIQQQQQPRMDQELLTKLNDRYTKIEQLDISTGGKNIVNNVSNGKKEEAAAVISEEEGVVMEYNVDQIIQDTLNADPLPPPPNRPVVTTNGNPKDMDDTGLLKKFRQRTKKQQVSSKDPSAIVLPDSSNDTVVPTASSVDDDEGKQLKVISYVKMSQTNSSAVSKTPSSSSIREQLRERLRSRINKGRSPNNNQKKAKLVKSGHISPAGVLNKKEIVEEQKKPGISMASKQEQRDEDDENITTKSIICNHLHNQEQNKAEVAVSIHNQEQQEEEQLDEDVENITVTSSICSSTTGGSPSHASTVTAGASVNSDIVQQEEKIDYNAMKDNVLETTSSANIAQQEDEADDTDLSVTSITPKKKNTKASLDGERSAGGSLHHSIRHMKQKEPRYQVEEVQATAKGHQEQEVQEEDIEGHRQDTAIAAMRQRISHLSSEFDQSHNIIEKTNVNNKAIEKTNVNNKAHRHGLHDNDVDKELELYASTSLMTAPTADMTEVPSSSYEDDSLSEVYTSLVYEVKSKDSYDTPAELNGEKEHAIKVDNIDPLDDDDDDDLSTPKLLMRLAKLRSNAGFFTSPVGSDNGDILTDELATPNLMMKADRFFSSTPRVIEDDKVQDNHMYASSSPVSRGDTEAIQSSASSFTQSRFEQIMSKYESIELSSCREEKARFELKEVNNATIVPLNIREEGKHSCSYARKKSSGTIFTSNARRDDGGNTHGIIRDISFRRQQHQEQSNQDSGECFMNIRHATSQDSDAVSTLSRTTAGYTTIGSVSISTENSAVIESYVQSIVNNILVNEVESAGSMKAELEAALKSKLKLKARVKKLLKKCDDQSLELKRAHMSKQIEKDKFNREMEVHLTRKASELKSMIKLALDQAEESKQRALELAKRDMEKEVSLLRSQLDAVQANGIPLEGSLLNALELVESNQQALRKAAENDAKSSLEMKKDIEQSFVNAIGEFEQWSDKQLEIMEKRWQNITI